MPAPAPRPLSTTWRHPLTAAGLALLMLASACAQPAGSGGAPPHPGPGATPAAPTAPGSPGTTLARLMAEVGDPVCTQDTQCRTVAVGSKACGGPERYLAWSTQVSNPARLKAAAEAHAAARQAEDERSGRISNCMMLVDPGARCVAQRCQLQTSPTGTSGDNPGGNPGSSSGGPALVR